MKLVPQTINDIKKCPSCGGAIEKDCWGIWCPNGKCKWPGIKA